MCQRTLPAASTARSSRFGSPQSTFRFSGTSISTSSPSASGCALRTDPPSNRRSIGNTGARFRRRRVPPSPRSSRVSGPSFGPVGTLAPSAGLAPSLGWRRQRLGLPPSLGAAPSPGGGPPSPGEPSAGPFRRRPTAGRPSATQRETRRRSTRSARAALRVLAKMPSRPLRLRPNCARHRELYFTPGAYPDARPRARRPPAA